MGNVINFDPLRESNNNIIYLKKKINEPGLPDALLALFYCAKSDLIKSGAELYKAIFELSKGDCDIPYIKDLVFDESGVTPFSNDLYDALIASGVPYTLTHPPSYYLVSEADKMEKAFNKFNPTEQEKILNGAESLKVLTYSRRW